MTVIILFILFVLLAILLIDGGDNPAIIFPPFIILIIAFLCSMNYRNSIIQYNNIEKEISIIKKNTDELASRIDKIKLENATSISLGDTPYKATIETYAMMMDKLNEKELMKVYYLKSIQFAESGFFRYTNKLFVNKERFITND